MAVTRILSILLSQSLLALAFERLNHRGVPAEPTGVQEMISQNGARITYKQPGKQGLCETTADDYAGYIRLNEKWVQPTNWEALEFEPRHARSECPEADTMTERTCSSGCLKRETRRMKSLSHSGSTADLAVILCKQQLEHFVRPSARRRRCYRA